MQILQTAKETIIPTNELLTIDQVCEYLQVKPSALAQLRYTGRGPAYFAPTAKTIRYDKADIDKWIADSRRLSTAA
jgi:predicted DNA-binding transcriptional regulator AlpA